MAATVVDFHQHLWPEQFVAALARRKTAPRLNGSTLELVSELASEVDLREHELDARLVLLDRCEIDVAVVSLAPTLGIAELPDDEADELLTAYEDGIAELAGGSKGRIVPLAARLGADGFSGLCLGAHELRDLQPLGPTLHELEQSSRFLFVHPGAAHPPPGAPRWWAPVVDYTAQMQAAYASWLAYGAERWPRLRVVFAILAGGGPFQFERLVSRGISGREIRYENVFFETASYARRALDLCLSTFGVEHLVFGSDAPVIDPEPMLTVVRGFGDAVTDALCHVNPTRLLSG